MNSDKIALANECIGKVLSSIFEKKEIDIKAFDKEVLDFFHNLLVQFELVPADTFTEPDTEEELEAVAGIPFETALNVRSEVVR